MSALDRKLQYHEDRCKTQMTAAGKDMPCTCDRDDALAELSALRERVEALVWVVKRLEYIEEYPTEEMLCPICRGEKPTHYEDCELAAALQAP